MEDNNDKNQSGGWFSKMLINAGKDFVRTVQKNNLEIEKAYLSGIEMDDHSLVRRFKESSGLKRIGYSRALEERGLLNRNAEGKLVPTDQFKQLY